jgi:hypothetical protein
MPVWLSGRIQSHQQSSAPLDRFVCAMPPFAGLKQVLAYLGRYTHRVAISNSRLVGMDGDRATFRWKDYRRSSNQR